jgi:hypothetical protein
VRVARAWPTQSAQPKLDRRHAEGVHIPVTLFRYRLHSKMGFGPPHLDLQEAPPTNVGGASFLTVDSTRAEKVQGAPFGLVLQVPDTEALPVVSELLKSKAYSWRLIGDRCGRRDPADAAAWVGPCHRDRALRWWRALSIQAVRPRFSPLQAFSSSALARRQERSRPLVCVKRAPGSPD